MQTFIGFLRDLGWGVTIGIVVLIVGGAFFAFFEKGETTKEKDKPPSRNSATEASG